jgi:hypothetical protein
MNRETLLALLRVQQQECGLWEAFLPEHPLLWTVAKTEEEARASWLCEYDVPMLYPAFEAVQRKRLGEYHLDRWHKEMTDQELQNVYKNLLPQLQHSPLDEYYSLCMNTLLFAQVEQVLRSLNAGK